MIKVAIHTKTQKQVAYEHLSAVNFEKYKSDVTYTIFKFKLKNIIIFDFYNFKNLMEKYGF